MTDRARFGDLLRLAAQRLDASDGAVARRTASGAEVCAAACALLDVVTVMTRLIAVSDASSPDAMGRRARQPGTWNRARAEVSRALDNATGFLSPHVAAQPGPGAEEGIAADGGGGVTMEQGAAGRLAAAALALRAGHDLLQTHYGRGGDGTREYRSTWAAAIDSDQVNIAMLAEMAKIAHRAAAQASGVALTPSRGARMAIRRDLNQACQWLWVLVAAVRTAHHDQPIPHVTSELLRHIPVNVLPDHRVPVGGEPVADLCDGAVSAAERVRHLAWDFTRRAAWSPAMSITTLSRTAGAAVVTSHNCEVLLTTLADCPHSAKLGPQLHDAALAAARARQTWFDAVHALADITTDTRGHQSLAAAEASDLALWTGRLAFTKPDWTPASGPGHPPRPPSSLVASPEDIPRVITAVHYACDTLTSLARTSRAQIQAADRASRILVPTRTLPEGSDVPYLFAPAPGPRVESVLARYHEAAVASRQATAKIAIIAEAVRAPSQIITAARDAGRPIGQAPRRDPQANTGHDALERDYHLPGPIENILHQLRITDPQLLEQATTLDRDGARLVIKAAGQLNPAHQRSALNALSRSMTTAPIANHALAFPEIKMPSALIPSPPSCEEQREAGL